MLSSQNTNTAQNGSAYDYTFTTLVESKPWPLSQLKNKVLLVVNTASECGYTRQYAGLEALYKQYQGKGLVVLGVPSNDFGAQEPGTAEDIANFCQAKYGVTFPLAEKQVVSGASAHPFYKWAAGVLGADNAPKWNFHKYLVDRHGKLTAAFNSKVEPDSQSFVDAIEKLLA